MHFDFGLENAVPNSFIVDTCSVQLIHFLDSCLQVGVAPSLQARRQNPLQGGLRAAQDCGEGAVGKGFSRSQDIWPGSGTSCSGPGSDDRDGKCKQSYIQGAGSGFYTKEEACVFGWANRHTEKLCILQARPSPAFDGGCVTFVAPSRFAWTTFERWSFWP